MKPARWRLILAASLFAALIGYIAFLAATTRHPIVLSRPQFLISNLDVIAFVEIREGQPPQVTVKEVHWPPEEAPKLVGKQIELMTDLRDCDGWRGPGTYILPLTSDTKGTYRVAPIPPSPGFEPRGGPPIYLDTAETRHQLDAIQKPEAMEIVN